MLAATDLALALAGRIVLADVNLALAPGALTVVVGPNGAGKSTLLKALSGTLAPARGQVTLDGMPLAAWSRHALARRRAVLAQNQHVAFPFTVFEVVALGQVTGAVYGSQALRRVVMESLAAVDLASYAGRFFQALSGGEQQRVQVARILCQLGGAATGRDGAPKWLFLDEPTSSLDVPHQLAVLDIARAHARRGGGALAVLHDLNLASLYADRIVMIRDGRIVADSTPDDVLEETRMRAVFSDRLRVIADPESGRRYIVPGGNP